MTSDVRNPTGETSYEVGYGKPPEETQWKPGQSGNPAGKARGPSLRAIFLRAASKKRNSSEPDGPFNPTVFEEVMRNILSQATLGNRFAHKRVLEMAREFFPEDSDDDAPDESK